MRRDWWLLFRDIFDCFGYVLIVAVLVFLFLAVYAVLHEAG